jgi:signal transduction histidine kinase/ligand-binding sensor domain-containing protein
LSGESNAAKTSLGLVAMSLGCHFRLNSFAIVLVAIALVMPMTTGLVAASSPPSTLARHRWPLVIDADSAGIVGVARLDVGPLVVCSTRDAFLVDSRGKRPLRCDLPARETFARGCLTVGSEANRRLIFLPLESGSLVVINGHKTRLVARQASMPHSSPGPENEAKPTSAGWSPTSGFWMGHMDGSVSRYHAGRLDSICGPSADSAYPRSHVAIDVRGRVWVARERTLAVWTDSGFTEQAELPAGEVLIAPSQEGGMWIKVRNQLLYHDGQRPSLETRAARTVGTATHLVEDRQGRLWIGTSRFGLHVWSGGELIEAPGDARWVKALHVDTEGIIWAGTPLGLYCYHDAVMAASTILPAQLISQLAGDARGAIWFLSPDGNVGRYQGSNTTPDRIDHEHQLLEEVRPLPLIEGRGTAIAGSDDGVWVGTRDGRLFRQASGRTTEVPLPALSSTDAITAMCVSEDSSLWFASGRAVVRYREGESTPDTMLAVSLDDQERVSVLLDHPPGTVCVATSTGRLLRLRVNESADAAGTVTVERHILPGGLPPEVEITSLCKASDDGLWMAVRNSGLWRFRDGRWSPVDGRHGLPSTRFTAVVDDQHGLLWCGIDGGLFIADRAELEAITDGRGSQAHCWQFPASDRTTFLREIATPRAAALVAADGRVCLGLRSGLAIGNPAALPRSGTSRVDVQRILVGDRTVAESDLLVANDEPFAQYVLLPRQPRDITIEYAIHSFMSPSNTAVFHQLVGIDSDWVPASADFSARYASLPTGRHEFRLRSSDHSGQRSERTIVVCEVPPPLWENAWFRGAATLFVAGCGGLAAAGLQALRSRDRIARLRQQAAVDRERMRIARDMHDDVGTSLNQIALLAEVARQKSTPGASERLDDVVAIARRTMASFDELVWAVNPENDSLPHLLSYVIQHATEVLGRFGIQSRVVMAPVFPEVPVAADVRHAILMIVKEAVANIVAHAEASRVEITTACKGGRLTITLTDDGRGIKDGNDSGGLGLQNMQVRAETFQGSVRVEPCETGGTAVRIDLAIPGPATTS